MKITNHFYSIHIYLCIHPWLEPIPTSHAMVYVTQRHCLATPKQSTLTQTLTFNTWLFSFLITTSGLVEVFIVVYMRSEESCLCWQLLTEVKPAKCPPFVTPCTLSLGGLGSSYEYLSLVTSPFWWLSPSPSQGGLLIGGVAKQIPGLTSIQFSALSIQIYQARVPEDHCEPSQVLQP